MNCCICSQIAGDAANDLFAKTIGASTYVRRVPIETANFAVIPSLGPLVPGHVIMCPKEHFLSFASLPSRFEEECDSLILALKRLLTELYSADVHLFEHGMATRGTRVLCTVEHAHLHLLPASVSVAKFLEPYLSVIVPVGLAGLRSLNEAEEYVFYESPMGARSLIRARDKQFESQYLRRVFAEALGHSGDWNWRDHMKATDANQTYERLASAVSEVCA